MGSNFQITCKLKLLFPVRPEAQGLLQREPRALAGLRQGEVRQIPRGGR